MKYLSYLFGVGLVAITLSACGGSSTAPAASTAAPTCGVANQVSTVQYGCVVPTGGSCTVPGTATPGIIYNGVCAQTNGVTTGAACTVAGQVSTLQYGCVYSSGSCVVPGTNAQGTLYNGTCAQINTATTGVYGASCQYGQVSTQFGCVANTGTCMVPGTNQQGVIYNNTCTAVINTGYNTGVNPGYPGMTGYPGMGGVVGGGACYNTVAGYLCQQQCGYGQVNYNGACYFLTNNQNVRLGGGYRGGAGFSFHIGL